MAAPRIVPEVVREHVELAAFQWAQRDTLAAEDLPDRDVIAGIDARLEANLDGLRIAGPAAWPFLIEQFEDYPGKGELFAVAVTAFEQEDERRIEQAVAFARTSGAAAGLVGALAWLPPSRTAPHVRAWLNSADPLRRWLAVSALVAHRADPGDRLPELLADPDPRIRAAAFELSARAVEGAPINRAEP